MTGSELKIALRSGRRVYGTCTVSPSPMWPAMIASTGVDFVFIDTEHIPIDRSELAWMCQTYSALGIPPVVRITSCRADLANLALDAGATGIVAQRTRSLKILMKIPAAGRGWRNLHRCPWACESLTRPRLKRRRPHDRARGELHPALRGRIPGTVRHSHWGHCKVVHTGIQ